MYKILEKDVILKILNVLDNCKIEVFVIISRIIDGVDNEALFDYDKFY